MPAPRINLVVLLLLALSIPIALYVLLSALARAVGSGNAASPILLIIGGLLALIVSFPVAYVSLLWLIRRLRRRSAEFEFGVEPPTCPHCHYDLRASPDHCPECGHPVPPLDRIIIQYLIRLRRKG
jgi:prepilin signal peptidase PulO-like enzyme (type II secretory pathway)